MRRRLSALWVACVLFVAVSGPSAAVDNSTSTPACNSGGGQTVWLDLQPRVHVKNQVFFCVYPVGVGRLDVAVNSWTPAPSVFLQLACSQELRLLECASLRRQQGPSLTHTHTHLLQFLGTSVGSLLRAVWADAAVAACRQAAGRLFARRQHPFNGDRPPCT
jgi:hypothetical protein